MPKSKKQGLCLSLIMSSIMIYVMAALNMAIRLGHLSGEVWLIALQRLPLGYIVGVLCDLCICTPLSRRIVQRTCSPGDKEMYQVFVLRFCMVILMTLVMTVFSVVVSGKFRREGLVDFFTYLPSSDADRRAAFPAGRAEDRKGGVICPSQGHRVRS